MGECTDAIIARCLSRVRRWRAPANYSRHDWLEELAAVVACAALVAQNEYDTSRGVPLDAFLYERVLAAALARYRQEWRFASRHRSDLDVPQEAQRYATRPANDGLTDVLARLPDADRRLIMRLFWDHRTEADLATQLAVTQQAINKRKSVALERLRIALT